MRRRVGSGANRILGSRSAKIVAKSSAASSATAGAVKIDVTRVRTVTAESSRLGRRHRVPSATSSRRGSGGLIRVSAAAGGGNPALVFQDGDGGARGERPLRIRPSFRMHRRRSAEAALAGTAAITPIGEPSVRRLRRKANPTGVFTADDDDRLLVATGVLLSSAVSAPADEESEKTDDGDDGRKQNSEQEHVHQHLFFFFLSRYRFRRSRVSAENQDEQVSIPLPLTSSGL